MLLTGCSTSIQDISMSVKDSVTKHLTCEEEDNDNVTVSANRLVITDVNSHCALAIERG